MAWIGAVIGAAGSYLSSKEQKEAAEKSGKVEPWGPTSMYLEELLGDAMHAWRRGDFQFGPSPYAYNAYLDYGRKLGVKLPQQMTVDPTAQQGYGPAAYDWMMNYISGPAWAGRSQTNYSGINPWASALMGGIGGYYSAGGTFGTNPQQAGAQSAQSFNPYQSYGVLG